VPVETAQVRATVPVNAPTGVKVNCAVLPVVAPEVTVILLGVPVEAVKPVTVRLVEAEVEPA
jgi:hypothetical protein